MIAILVYVHKNKELAQRLINKLVHKDVDIYVHVDLKYDVKSFDNAKMIKNRCSISWGDSSIIDSIISSLDEIKDSKYTHYILISGQDYPIVNINEIVDFLNNNKSKEFIEYKKIGKNKDEWNVEYRYNYYHFINNKYLNKISQKLFHNRKFIKDYIVYGGSLWWMLTHNSI